MKQRGFTLVEVVVAFAMLAIVLATVFEIFTSGIARASELDSYTRALALAQSELASAGVEEPLAEGEVRGETEDRQLRWSLSTQEYKDPSADPTKPIAIVPYTLYRVESRVTWTTAAGLDRQVVLSTLLIQQNK